MTLHTVRGVRGRRSMISCPPAGMSPYMDLSLSVGSCCVAVRAWPTLLRALPLNRMRAAALCLAATWCACHLLNRWMAVR